MFCQTCGTPIEEGAKACTVCGTFVENTTPVVTTNPEPVYSAPINTTPSTPTVDPGQSDGKTSVILGIVALAMGTICSCLAACLGGFVPLVCAVVSIVMGTQAMNKSKAAGFENKQAKLGVTLSIVAIAVIFIFIIVNAVIGGILGATGAYDSYYYY